MVMTGVHRDATADSPVAGSSWVCVWFGGFGIQVYPFHLP